MIKAREIPRSGLLDSGRRGSRAAEDGCLTDIGGGDGGRVLGVGVWAGCTAALGGGGGVGMTRPPAGDAVFDGDFRHGSHKV